MGAKLKAVRTELILLGLTAVFLGGLLTVSYRDRTTAEVAVTAEHTLPPEEVEVTLVDLNTAGIEDLATLPGIGEGLAKRIVDYRTEHGPFEGPEGLLEVSGIGEKKLEELRDYITVSNEVYERISSSIADTTTLVTTLIVVITVVSMVLIILILSMSIRSRKRETGILLAVGIAKPAVILQYVLETMLIAVVAFPLAYLSSKQVAGALGTLFGKAAENVIVTPEHFMLVAIVGGILLVAAVLVSSISTMRLKPKQILAQME